MNVPEVGGEQRQPGLNLDTRAIPAEQRAHREGMAHVVDPWTACCRARRQPSPVAELAEGRVHVAIEQPGPGRGDQHRVGDRLRAETITQPQIGAQRIDRRGVHWQLARLAELRAAHRHDRVVQVEVLAVHADRLPDTHARDRQEPNQRPVGRLAQREAQRSGRGHQRDDVLLRVQVRDRPVHPVGQQVSWRDLVRVVERVQGSGEASDG